MINIMSISCQCHFDLFVSFYVLSYFLIRPLLGSNILGLPKKQQIVKKKDASQRHCCLLLQVHFKLKFCVYESKIAFSLDVAFAD